MTRRRPKLIGPHADIGDDPGPPALEVDGPEITGLVRQAGDVVVCLGFR